jgi:hypothetical protein
MARQIAGRSSPFAKALAELDRRRAAGEDVVLVRPDESTIMIVPRSDISENVAQMPSRS